MPNVVATVPSVNEEATTTASMRSTGTRRLPERLAGEGGQRLLLGNSVFVLADYVIEFYNLELSDMILCLSVLFEGSLPDFQR